MEETGGNRGGNEVEHRGGIGQEWMRVHYVE